MSFHDLIAHFFILSYLFIFRERGREGEREGERLWFADYQQFHMVHSNGSKAYLVRVSCFPQGQGPEHVCLIIPSKTWNWLAEPKSLNKVLLTDEVELLSGQLAIVVQQVLLGWSLRSVVSLFSEMQLGFSILCEWPASLPPLEK